MDKQSYYSIIPDSIEASIWKIAKKEGFENFKIETIENLAENQNISSDIVRLIVQETDKNKDNGGDLHPDLHLIYKNISFNENLVKTFGIKYLFEREVYVYEKVFPKISDFLKKHNAVEFFKVPKIFGSKCDPQTEEYFIIFEDLTETGRKLYNQYCDFDLNHCKVVLNQLAKFHAISFTMRDQEPEIFDQIKSNLHDIYVDQRKTNEAMYDFTKASLESALSTLTTTDTLELQKFTEITNDFIELLEQCVDMVTSEPYAVICHGDTWCNNLLFEYKADHPYFVYLLDWQLCRFGSPVLDLTHFLFISTTKEFREKHYNDLLGYYYETLSAAINHLNSNCQTLFPFQSFQNHLERFGVFGLILSPIFLFFFTGGYSPRTELLEIILNYRSRSELFVNGSLLYKEMMSGLIKDCVKYKYV